MDIVKFPGLWGLEIPVRREAFYIFEIPIYWYGIIIAAAFLVAVLLGMKDSRKFGLVPDNVIDLVLFAAPVAIIFARLYYVIFSWESFKDNLLEIFNTRTGGLAIYGGILGALLVAYIFARVKKIKFMELMDFGVPYLVLAQAIGRWGNFVNREAFGTNTTLPWGMTSNTIKGELARLQLEGISVNPDIPVHPTFLYESLWNLSIFLLLMWYRNRKKLDGEVFFLYMSLYGLGRFFIEGLRTDSLYLGNLRISQLLALLFAIAFGILFVLRRGKAGRLAEEEVEVGTSKYGDILKKMQEEEAGERAAEPIEGADNGIDAEKNENAGIRNEDTDDGTVGNENSAEHEGTLQKEGAAEKADTAGDGSSAGNKRPSGEADTGIDDPEK